MSNHDRSCIVAKGLACAAFVALSIAIVPSARAQLAPTGDFYAGRATDTGFAGKVNAVGGYAASVPLNLPPSRGGIPVPVEVTFGGHDVGAAGVGWDVPLSFVRVDTSIAKRKPQNVPNGPAQGRLRVLLSIAGQSLSLVPKGNTWVSQQDGTLYSASVSGSSWLVSDGAGHMYTFTEPVGHTGIGFWLLTKVVGPEGTAMTLDYDVASVPLTGDDAMSVDLKAVSYNFQPALGCAKDTIELSYGTPSPSPLAITVVPAVMVRMHTLSSIAVNARSSCASQVTLRRYAFTYAPDVDSQLPRLQGVVVYGRDGTPEASFALPVATYHYGSASSNGALTFGQASTIAIPQTPGLDSAHLATSSEASISLPGSGPAYATGQNLIDLTGDGRPDVVYSQQNTLWIARNVPEGNGGAFAAPSVLGDLGLTMSAPVSDSKLTQKRFTDNLPANRENIWRQFIDINGDGRIDVIDASLHPGQWTVFLNTPGGGPSKVVWQERVIPIGTLRDRLRGYGHSFDDDDHLPLARRYTARENWTTYDDLGYLTTSRAEYTYTEWELKDVNGDGLPDLVFNTQPVQMASYYVSDDRNPNIEYINSIPQPGPGPNAIAAMFDVTAVTLDSQNAAPYREVFSEPSVMIDDPSSCGLEMWLESNGGVEQNGGSDQFLRCTLADVSGDGIADRIDHSTAYLGLGNAFSKIQVPLPKDFVGRHWSGRYGQCTGQTGTSPFQSFVTAGLRDVTGDGIADLVVEKDVYVDYEVYVGTGFGFRPTPLAVNGIGHLSEQYEQCDGGGSVTWGGLYDIDGDGRPETVHVDSSGAMTVQALVGASGTPGIPDAGQLTAIDNGYGATVAITYQSAKHDASTEHAVPFPEIVVASVQTHRASETGGDVLAATRYAYGGARLSYDPRAAAFVFTGYRRVVSLRTYGELADKAVGQATISDTMGLTPYTNGTHDDEFTRLAIVGRQFGTTVLSGTLGSDPWQLLTVDAVNDTRQTERTTYALASRLTEEPAAPTEVLTDCLDYPDPYDYDASLGQALVGLDACSAHGFTYAASTVVNRGAPPPSTASVQTRTRTLSIDTLGRATQVAYDNDVNRDDDDVCVDTTYAVPTGSGPPVLIAPATRELRACGKTSFTYKFDRYEYDALPVGQVAAGYETSHTLERHATDTGALVTKVRVFDGTYDAVGNLIHAISVRDDNIYREASYTYDPFGLVSVKSVASGSGVPTLTTTTTVDPYALDPLVVTDANGTQRGVTYDGFQRPTSTTVLLPDGTGGVQSTTSYAGFSGGTGPRQITATRFDDPVPAAQVASTVGHSTTVVLDELGRAVREEASLGTDYSGQVVVTGFRTFDPLGRVAFAADPFPSTADPSKAYGTSYYFNPDGTANCFVRANGPQSLTAISDNASETFARCFYHGYANHLETFGASDADANLPGSPQYGTLRLETTTAIGRVLSRSTSHSGTVLEYSTFAQDGLGLPASETRYKTPASATNPVTSRWRHDSYGNVLSQQDPEGPLTSYVDDSWGETTQIVWADTTTNPATDRRIVATYDAYGRLTHREEHSAGVLDAATVNDYAYDVGEQVSPEVTPTHLLGRLAAAAAPTSKAYFSYDGYGTPNATTWLAGDGRHYVQTLAHRSDGTLTAMDFYLPDTGYEPEHVSFRYDSATRLRGATYTTSAQNAVLYDVASYDPFGRILDAKYGAAEFTATYDTSGRELLRHASVTSPYGFRDFSFDVYDPLGRELHRYEKTGAPSDLSATHTFDALGRLSGDTVITHGVTTASWSYAYDPLGNLSNTTDAVSGAAMAATYRSVDEDESCAIGYPNIGTGCNVSHDYFGNVVSMPSRTGTRKLDFFLSGQVKKVTDANTTATFQYDAFGGLQDLLVTGTTDDNRRQRRYGSSIEVFDAANLSYVARSIPGPGGVVVTLRGSGADPVYAFAERRGVRFTTNREGMFLQDITYQPFGAPISTGAAMGSPDYTTEQWNGGDELASLGLSILGARLYDPMIGRFLSRDPIHIPRTASTTNPYAFSANDPINRSDPSGRDWEDGCIGVECQGLDWLGVFGFGGGGGGGGGGHGSNGDQGLRGGATPPPTRPPMTGKTDGACQYPDGAAGCNDAMWPTWRKSPWYEHAWNATGRGLRGIGHGYVWTMEHVQRGAEVVLDFIDENAVAIEDGVVAGLMAAAEPEILLNELYTTGVAALDRIFRGITDADEVAAEEPALPELTISESRYPDLADNIRNAQRAGHPDVLTHGGDIDANRAAALDGVPNIRPFERDEYPFASSMEGGAGSWVGHIPAAQQRAQGGLISRFIQRYNIQPGDRYRVVIVP